MKRRKNNVLSALIGLVIGGVIAPFALAAPRDYSGLIIVREGIIPEEKDPLMELVEKVRRYESEKAIETKEVKNGIEGFIEMADMLSKIEAITETEAETLAETEATIEENEAYYQYTQEDIYLVGNAVFHEVGILFARCSEEEAIMAARLTASCLVNRAKMNYLWLGCNISDQLDSGEYACAEKVTAERQLDVPEIFYEIATDIMQNGPEYSERLIFQAQFEQGELVTTINNQYFGLIPIEEYEIYN